MGTHPREWAPTEVGQIFQSLLVQGGILLVVKAQYWELGGDTGLCAHGVHTACGCLAQYDMHGDSL